MGDPRPCSQFQGLLNPKYQRRGAWRRWHTCLEIRLSAACAGVRSGKRKRVAGYSLRMSQPNTCTQRCGVSWRCLTGRSTLLFKEQRLLTATLPSHAQIPAMYAMEAPKWGAPSQTTHNRHLIVTLPIRKVVAWQSRATRKDCLRRSPPLAWSPESGASRG